MDTLVHGPAAGDGQEWAPNEFRVPGSNDAADDQARDADQNVAQVHAVRMQAAKLPSRAAAPERSEGLLAAGGAAANP